jgi:hypothetical protein
MSELSAIKLGIVKINDSLAKIHKKLSAMDEKLSKLITVPGGIEEALADNPQPKEVEFSTRLSCYVDAIGNHFCPLCYKEKGIFILLKPLSDNSVWKCLSCNTIVNNPDFVDPKITRINSRKLRP